MFFLQDSARQGLHGITIQNRNDSLGHDGTSVEDVVHQVDGTATDPHAVIQRLFLRFQTGKCRQQRRMNVQNAVWEGVDEHGN
jgi:hypothetical protein